jgi:hypothetical protein
MKDMKAALGNGTKPDLTHVRGGLETYAARACEYGSAKYERGNYLRPTENNTPKENFERLREYLGSVKRHLSKQLKSMEAHLALDPNLEDVEGMKAAAYAPDTDPGNDKVGPSNLPHLAHLSAGLMMALEQAITYGILPEDPGRTWDLKESQKGAPADLVAKLFDLYQCPHGVAEDYYCTDCQNRVRPPGANAAAKWAPTP